MEFGDDEQLAFNWSTKLDDFNLPIVKVPIYFYSKIPTAPAYLKKNIIHLFILLGFTWYMITAEGEIAYTSLRRYQGRCYVLVECYTVSVSGWHIICLHCHSLFCPFYFVYHKYLGNTVGSHVEEELLILPGLTPVFMGSCFLHFGHVCVFRYWFSIFHNAFPSFSFFPLNCVSVQFVYATI